MNRRERFLNACRCQPVDRPPVWVMRQAGRHLPEYLALKEKHSFHEIVQTPELALEVTMQPLRRYAMDAAILFSDILVIPEAMGQPYHFRDIGGIEMEFKLETAADIDALNADGTADRLRYVSDAIDLIKAELDGDRALIGFAGSPWTLATYMLEGGSSKNYRRCKELLYTDRPLFDRLMEKITASVIEYFQMQIDAGVDCVQIFDSWGGVLAPDVYEAGSVRWMREIVDAVKDQVPVILFSKGMHEHSDLLVSTGANVLGVTWTTSLAKVAAGLPDHIGVQGNLDPVLMNTTPELVEAATKALLDEMDNRPGHIFNLGHGIMPQAKIECMERMVDTVVAAAR